MTETNISPESHKRYYHVYSIRIKTETYESIKELTVQFDIETNSIYVSKSKLLEKLEESKNTFDGKIIVWEIKNHEVLLNE